ncbi:hypothetical protein [Streptacidiphilus rugosus]|uniref:hypothetical protein n=1 Tax=Streptacidiphilus rugosus TaxID=405783 RepID=UPI00055CA28C|nr:hypothetical protein [Streptacidiphilus rugosus]
MEPQSAQPQQAWPTGKPLSPVVRFAMVVPLTLGAAYAALLLTLASSQTGVLFAWTMSPVSATLIGAGYAGSCAMLWLCGARARGWTHARVSVLSSSLFMLLMLAAILLEHGTLHLRGGALVAVLAALGWFAVHLVAPLVGAVGLGAQWFWTKGAEPERPDPMPWWIALPTFCSGAFLGLLGLLLYLAPGWAVRHWPWAVSRLDVRVLAAFALTFGAAMLMAVRERELHRVRHGMAALIVTGLLGLVGLVRYGGRVHWGSLGAWGVVAVLLLLVGMGLSGLGLSVVLPQSIPLAADTTVTQAPPATTSGAGNPA